MNKKLFALLLILYFTVAVTAHTSDPFPSPTPSPTPFELPKKDIEAVKDFTPNIIAAQFFCASQDQFLLRVDFDQSRREIERVASIFKSTMYENTYLDEKSYYLIDLSTRKPIELEKSVFEIERDENYVLFKVKLSSPCETQTAAQAETPPTAQTVAVSETQTEEKFDISHKYSLMFIGKKFADKKEVENTLLTSVTVSPSCENIPEKLSAAGKFKDLSPPAVYDYAIENFKLNKSSPEVKVSFAVNGEQPTKPIYETAVSAEPFELKRLGIRGTYSVVPIFFNLERNNTPENEIDKMSFGAKFKHLFAFNSDGRYSAPNEKTSRFIGIKSELSPKVETTTKFKKVNLILGYKSGLPINVFQVRSHSLRVSPFIGFDLGYTLKDENATTKEKWILRPNFGFEFYYTPFRSEKDVPFLIESTFITRAFLKPEVISTRDAARKVIVEGPSTNPKVYFNTQVTFLSTKFISPFVRYSWGRDAPQFLLEDHKYRAGIQANFNWGK